MKEKDSIIIKLSTGEELDFYSLSRKDRKNLIKKFPQLKTKIEAAKAELLAEKDKNGADF